MAIKSFEELQQYIDDLPSIAKGYVRLFRGQNEDYGTILASAHRGSVIEGRVQWDQYCFVLAKYLLAKEGNTSYDDVNLLSYWVRVLSQHYGPGTEFLDVTKSIEVATWFALNKIKDNSFQGYSGEGKEISRKDIITVNKYFSYTQFKKNGVIYVLDVPENLNGSILEEGVSINLSESLTSIFQKSERIKIQEASLVKCDLEINDGDISSFLACDPIEIEPSCLHEIGEKYTVASLFPSPQKDEWYDRFIRVPYSIHGFSSEQQMAGKRTIPVDFYHDDTPGYFDSVLNRVTTRQPFIQYLHHTPDNSDEQKSYSKAIPICLPNPVLATSPSVEGGRWHEGLLWLYAQLKMTDGINQLKVGHDNCDLNFFVEFSPLEKANWLEIDEKVDDELNIRALWVRSYHEKLLKVRLFIDGYNGTKGMEIHAVLYYNTTEKAIVLRTEPDAKDILLSSSELLAKPIYVVLTMLGGNTPSN